MTTTKRRLVRGSFNNILDCFERASSETVTEGSVWYPTANTWANFVGTGVSNNGHAKLDYRDERVLVGAGIISALSPQTNWEQNKEMACYFAKTLDKPSWCTDVNYNKALAIVKAGNSISTQRTSSLDAIENILNGNKTKAFFHNIVHPYGENNLPTIDRHAISIYLGRRCTYKELVRGLAKGTANKTITNAYIKASKILECNPQIVQAVTWVQWRKEINGEV
jgi:hypothetical protein